MQSNHFHRYIQFCLLLLSSFSAIAQNVGIGTTTPVAPLNIYHSSSPYTLYNSSYTGTSISDGLYVGISGSGNKAYVWNYENAGIGFGTNGSERLTIASDGSVSIDNQLSLNTTSKNSLLYLKGNLNFGAGAWGQHLILENTSDAGYGGIVHDADGMKFRNFTLGDAYYFRNSLNQSILTISDDGSLKVKNGYGIVRSNSSTQLKTVLYQGNIAVSLGAGGSVTFPITFEAFSAAPFISVANIPEGTGAFDKVVYTVHGADTNSATVTIYNPTGSTASISGTFRAIIIGAE